MGAWLVEGGRELRGEVRVQGAKNSVLPILAATILCPGVSVLHNCPDLSDVRASLEILRHLGCQVEREGDTVTVDAAALSRFDVPHQLMREMRSSVIFLGAILGRLGQAQLSMPGGCELGPRPIDLHLGAIRTLGGEIEEEGGELHCAAPHGLRGKAVNLALPSVGATENAMLTAVCAQGVTTIVNAAREPEIVDLQIFLRAMGARVWGAGSGLITIEGGYPLKGARHRIMGDRIVAATLCAAVAAAGGEVTLTGVDYRHCSTVTAVLSEAGCQVTSRPDEIVIARQGRLKAVRPVRTGPYPGFPTDAQPPVMAALCTAEGASVLVENMFTSRYRHVDELRRMGADVRVEGRVAVVCGVERLQGAAVKAADLRGGAALAVAALGAKGVSELTGLKHIRRGYEDLPGTLNRLGAHIWEAP